MYLGSGENVEGTTHDRPKGAEAGNGEDGNDEFSNAASG